ncbi:MAG: hypothetical protein GXO10_02310 [Crenarchaeota archaeon]|nr:hypothetical protein [Thermoproteota archaeon]
MVFEKFAKKKEKYTPPQQPMPPTQQPPPPQIQTSHIIEEVRTYLANILSTVSKIESDLRELGDRVDRLEKTIRGYFIIQVSHIPSTLTDLVKLLGLRGGAVLRNNVIIEQVGDLMIDPVVLLSSIDFDNILHIDRGGTHIYVLKHDDKVIYVESDRELDYCVLAIIRKFLEFF